MQNTNTQANRKRSGTNGRQGGGKEDEKRKGFRKKMKMMKMMKMMTMMTMMKMMTMTMTMMMMMMMMKMILLSSPSSFLPVCTPKAERVSTRWNDGFVQKLTTHRAVPLFCFHALVTHLGPQTAELDSNSNSNSNSNETRRDETR